MTVKKTLLVVMVSAIFCASCTDSGKINGETTTVETITHSKKTDMKSYVAMFEIPVTDISRAIHFYQALLDIKIEKMEVAGMQMGILPYEGQMVTGIIVQSEGYNPSADGVTVYLNAGENLQEALDKVEKNGGKILMPKTAYPDESGYFAIFLDTERNKMALHSPN